MMAWWRQLDSAKKALWAIGLVFVLGFSLGGALDRALNSVFRAPDDLARLRSEYIDHIEWGEMALKALRATDDSLGIAIRELGQHAAARDDRLFILQRQMCLLFRAENIQSSDCPAERRGSQ